MYILVNTDINMSSIFKLCIYVTTIVVLSSIILFIHDMWGSIPKYTFHKLAIKYWHGQGFMLRLLQSVSYVITFGLFLSLRFTSWRYLLKVLTITIPVLITIIKECQSYSKHLMEYNMELPYYSRHPLARKRIHAIWLTFLYMLLIFGTIFVYFTVASLPMVAK